MYSDGYMSSKGLNDTSDMRLKNKVRDIFLPVKDIANAPAFEYTWKDGTPGAMVGSSAQYWEKVLPPSVKKNKDGYLSLFSGHTALVAAISVAREVETLEKRVARLEKENKEKDKTIEKMSETKIILDACCGSRMFWFDKENPLTLFADIRDEEHTLCDGRSLKVHPDIISDFTDMPFLDESFKLVVFDPPHLLKAGKNSWLAKKYGKLPEDWPRVIKKGIDECFRVLEDYGVLIFKWNEDQITVREVLEVIGRKPLFGHTTGRHGKTMWMCFMKLPNNV